MVHITDARAQKVVSYTSAHITETAFAHNPHHSYIVIRKSTENR